MSRLSEKSKNPFQFSTSLKLKELTEKKARTVKELAEAIKDIPGASIYYHTHVFLQKHQSLSPEPPNDFAYWVANTLGEHKLGEELAAIDICAFSTIRELREKIINVIENHLFESKNPLRYASPGQEFEFIKRTVLLCPQGLRPTVFLNLFRPLKRLRFTQYTFIFLRQN